MVHAELRLWRGTWALLRRRPLPIHDDTPQRFHPLDGSAYPQLVGGLGALLLLEIPAVHLALGAMVDPGLLRSALQFGLAVSTIYLGVWVLGDLRLLQESAGITVTPTSIVIDYGQRVCGTIPRSLARGVGVFEPGAGPNGSIRLAPVPFEANCELRLSEPVRLRGLQGRSVMGDRVVMHLRDPESLAAALERSANLDRCRHD